MSIFVDLNSDAFSVHELTVYFDFNHIQWNQIDLWDFNQDAAGLIRLPSTLFDGDGHLLIITPPWFDTLLSESFTASQVQKFCENNFIWIINCDMLPPFTKKIQKIIDFDLLVRPESITMFFDGKLTDGNQLHNLKNIKHHSVPYSHFLAKNTRIHNSRLVKHNCSKDFLLTTIRKKSRPHRNILYHQMMSIKGLMQCGHVSFRYMKDKTTGWIGQKSQQHWLDGHPSMDLYLDSWLEVVPETQYKDQYFITEKTVKPLATMTPFLTVGICRYHDYLRQQGFKTFNGIIDESYDEQHHIEDRIKLMLIQLQDIIKNGSESFYKACLPILQHNQNRLFEIQGRYQFDYDLFFVEHLEKINAIK